ncbi:MAG: non-ribosomal peptide synthetase [Anaerolineaceae bacterium]|nr:non-ribosomal peptide synthetase [Anaerolineaceae bacterium]
MNLSSIPQTVDENEFLLTQNNPYIENSPLQREHTLGNNHPSLNGSSAFEFAEIEQSVPERFEKMVRRYPQHIAIKTKTESLTFSGLNEAANRIAHTILQQDTDIEESMVGVLLKQGGAFLAAMLGTLKSGKTYIPIDPSFPRERLNLIIADSQPGILITTTEHQALAHELIADGGHIINLDEIPDDISGENPHHPISPDTLAYIIYTSGSTGRPKGVMQNHRNLLHNCRNNTLLYQITANDRLILLYSSSVMGAVRVIYNALLNGAGLYHVDVKEHGLPELTRTLLQEKITVYHSVASLFRFFAQTLTSEQAFPYLRGIIMGGEATLSSDVELYKRHFPQALLYVGIGSTEAGTMRQIVLDKDTILHGSVVPPGYPVENMDVMILDEAGQPVGPGEIGEIVVRSKYISLGYWQRPDLTQKVFREHPDSGERTYLTGDLGVILPDGCLVHRGRKDFQVKIRGFRVELTEIEGALRDSGQVGETVVVGHKDPAGNMKLIAYVVPPDDEEISRRGLRDLLKTKLPDYMVPSFFVTLDALPRTPNGKVNRKALPIPDLSHPERLTDYVAPRSEIEQILAQIWSQVLHVEQIGVHDNFFELGGHSLSVTQLVSRIRQQRLGQVEPLDVFANPTVAELAALLAARQAQPRELTAAIEPVPRQDHMPLSFSQQRLWFLNQLEPESAAYHISVAYRLHGKLNIEALARSFNGIIERHESLRTVFGQDDGVPYQVILPEMAFHLEQFDLRQAAKTVLEDELQQKIAAFNRRPFNLKTGPLLRAALFQVANEQYVLAITKHHIISDGSSQGILLQELSTLYAGYVADDPQPLPELPVQYADFSVWQQEWLSGQTLDDQLAYWREQLTGAPPFLELPTDYPRPNKQTFCGGREVLVLPESLTTELNALSRRENATLFMTLLSAFKILLRRLAGQEDIVVGTPIAGRNRAEIENLIGFFINNLVIRTDVADDLTFRELLAAVRTEALGAYAHQDLPFEKLLEALKPERDLSRTPIFQVFFNMLNVELYQLDLAGLQVERVSRTDRESKFDLTLYAREQDGRIHLRLIYNADLFTAVRMAELLRQFQILLSQIIRQPNHKLADYQLVTKTARQRLPNPVKPQPETWPGAIHALVSQQAQNAPEKVALWDAQAAWTYGELEAHSNQLAHYLRANDIGSGDIVAIYADRAASLVWSMLSILKAGAAFLILDPAYPAGRLQRYLLEAQPKGWIQLETAVSPPPTITEWLDQTDLACRLTLPAAPTAVPAAIAQQPTTPPEITVNPDDLAYLIFTSGTTGKPKGILGRHRPLSHFFPWQIKTFGLKAEDRFSMLSGLAHDPLLRDIFTPLLAGAALYIPTQDELLQPGELARWLEKHQITAAHLTPALGQVIAMTTAAQTAVALPTLRYAFFGGDRLTRQDVQTLQTLADNVTCVNFYGTTETPQAMAYHIASPTEVTGDAAENLVPIGQGIADVQLLVLNANQRLAGIGELGEIYIRTPYLAQGYLHDTSLTSKRFVASPLTGNPDDTWYRTGDLGRYTPAGMVMFHGRADRQVKIRGFRVELLEIEAALGQIDGVANAIVTAPASHTGKVQLVAYVVMAGEWPFSPTDLRTELAKTLPSYMLPAAFVPLEQLPLTPNGKIDYAQLPLPDQTALLNHDSYAPPTDALENQLVNIWEMILDIRPIGIHDNYFEIGGQSLQTIALFAQIEKVFKSRIPLATIFQAPTVAELAAVMRQNGETDTWSSLVPIAPSGSKRPFFCVHGGAGHVYHYRALAQHLGAEQPFYGLQPGKGSGASGHPKENVKKMAAAYLQEIRQVQSEGPYYVGGFCFGAIVAFEMAQQLTRLGETVALVALIDALEPGYNGQIIPPAGLPRLDDFEGEDPEQLTGVAKMKLMIASTMRQLYAASAPVRRSWRRLNKSRDKWLVRFYKAVRRPLPHHLQNYEMLAAARTARKQYVPEPYPGDLAVFRRGDVAEEIPADMGWSRLTSQKVQIYEIPGGHLQLLQEPYVQELARQLEVSINKGR